MEVGLWHDMYDRIILYYPARHMPEYIHVQHKYCDLFFFFFTRRQKTLS